MKPARVTAPTLALALIVVVGCSDQGTPVDPRDPPAGNDPVSYTADLQPIWNANCLGCHGVGGAGGLELSAAVGTAALVNVASTSYAGARVVPGDPQASVLYLKLEGDAGTGDRMPQGGALSAGELEVIHHWIAEGALDN